MNNQVPGCEFRVQIIAPIISNSRMLQHKCQNLWPGYGGLAESASKLNGTCLAATSTSYDRHAVVRKDFTIVSRD